MKMAAHPDAKGPNNRCEFISHTHRAGHRQPSPHIYNYLENQTLMNERQKHALFYLHLSICFVCN